jgi:competence ComEA-like helix-hairpin-helix protein
MPAWTPAERRGALLVALLLSLGAARDLWRATHPRVTAAPPATADGPSGPSPAGATAPTGRWGTAPGDAVVPVDLNQAGLAELDALPGIGPVLAGRILQHRDAHGPFREPEDLLAVPGIGPRLFERLRPRVRVGSPAVAGPGPGARPEGPPGP